MGKIQVLSENIIHKIAAGEVIERPSSVVKELVENSIDAQAKRVSVEVKAGGRQDIIVADDGIGMSFDDALLSVKRHSTSKMKSPSDLFSVSTLGFRGEALASIGAVSRMTIETRSAEDNEGTRIVVEGGIEREKGPVARAVGTTISVRNIFFNTPARRKFLRHMETENRYITQNLVQLSAAHPDVGFELIHQDRNILDFLPGSRFERARELLESEPDSLLETSLADEGIEVDAFVSMPAQCRRSRGKQFIVVRGRPIFSRGLNQAVYNGYGGLLVDRHPSFIVWLDLDPRKIDVNVHPTKREVRFADERRVAGVIQAAVRQALNMPEMEVFNYTKSSEKETTLKFSDGANENKPQSRTYSSEANALEFNLSDGSVDESQLSLSLLAPSLPGGEKVPGESPVSDSLGKEILGDIETSPAIWQVHNKYIIVPIKEGIIIVDQHVAHERIRYEEALDNFEAEGVGVQQLLLPLTLNLNPVEMEVVREASDLFSQLGFNVREFGPATVIVESIPVELKNWGEGEIFHKMVNELLEEKEIRNTLQEAVAASYACHTSIRAGENLKRDDMQVLIKRLLGAREPFVCPHGRPIIVKIPLDELDRLFGRI